MIALAVFLLLAQSYETLELPCPWKVGEQWELELIKSKEKWKGDARVSAGKTSTPIVMEVVEKTDGGFVLRWTFGETRFLEGLEKSGANELAARMADLTRGLRLDLRTDIHGELQEIANVDEALAAYQKTMDELQQWMTEQAIPELTIRGLLKALEPLRSKETATVMLMKEPSTVLALRGMVFETGKKLEYEDQLPNPFGGTPLPSKGWFLLEEIQTDAHTARIEWRQSIDGLKAKDVLRESMELIAKQANLPPPKLDDIPVFQIEDFAHYLVDTDTGWPRTVEYTREVSSGSDRSVDRMEFRIERKEPPDPNR